LLYSNCDSPAGRNHGTVWVSFDGGKTWPLKRLVWKDPFQYSSLAAGRPGTESEGWIYMHFEGRVPHDSHVARFTDGESLFVFFGRSGVRAYDLDGKLLWDTVVGSNVNGYGWGSGASPILFGDLVIVNASIESESLVALDKKTGKEVWKATGIRESWSTPLVVDVPDGGRELVLAMHGKVVGFNPATGERLWQCEGFPDYVVPMTVADDKGVVYITGGRSSSTLAVRAGGRGDVTETHLLWRLNKGCKVPSPLVHDGLLYWVSNLDTAACIEADTGEIVYHQRLAERGAFYGSAVMAEGRIYAVSKMRGTVVLAAGREYKELARNKLDDESLFNATPVITNGQLLLRSDRFLYCIGK